MSGFDFLVLGGGIAAYGTALELLARGARVCLVRRTGAAGEATPHAAGILDPFLGDSARSPLLALKRDAFLEYPARIRALEARTGRDAGYRRTGLTYLAHSQAERRILAGRYRWQRATGIRMRWLEPETGKHEGGLVFPTAGRVMPRCLLVALREDFRRRGGVESLCRRIRLRIDRERAAGLVLDGRFTASRGVIDAAGCWSARLAAGVFRLPVRPVRGQILLLSGRRGPETILHGLDGTYLVPWEDGVWLAGSTVEEAGYRAAVTSSGIRSILTRAARLYPPVSAMRVIRSWAGLRPCMPDGLPVLGEDRVAGLYRANGYFRSGILLGMHAGRLLARGILEGRMPREIRRFDPRRFEPGRVRKQ